jgi:subtilase family serine protease
MRKSNPHFSAKFAVAVPFFSATRQLVTKVHVLWNALDGVLRFDGFCMILSHLVIFRLGGVSMVSFRVLTCTALLSGVAFAASSQPVCPGPAAEGSARCHSQVTNDQNGKPFASSSPTGYGPTQFRTAYNLTSTGSSSTTIGIVDAYDDPNIESDLGVYSTYYGLPACTTANGCFKKVNQTGGTKYPKSNSGWALEISLDVEIAHAICPGCKIMLVEANSTSFSDLLAAEDYATAHATVVSNSWGGSESSSEVSSYDSHFNHIGVPITVSSGDGGYGVEYPAASQYVTAVGGTTLNLNANGTYKSETVWSGAGSGCSAYEPKPTWQTDAGCIRRTVADVAADADPNTGAAVYDSVRYQGAAGWLQVGGTSLASPLTASVYALAGNGANTVDGSYPYAHTSSLHDVTSGSNGSCGGSYLCTGVVGYDGPTGNGTPNGTNAF